MTVADVGIRRVLLALLATVLLFGAVSAVAAHRAEAAYPGGSDWVVFENTAGDSELWVQAADGSGSPVQLTNDAWFQADPVFSPDGTKLAFASNHEGQSSIYIAAFDPSGPSINAQGSWVRVTSGGVDGEPTWSPDGTEIAFERWFTFYLTGTADLTSPTTLLDDATAPSGPATFATSGVVAEMTVTNTTTAESGPAVSVFETSLTVDALDFPAGWTVGDEYSVEVIHARIFKAPVTPGAATQLGGNTSTPSYTDRYPAWDPTGSLIAFATSRNGGGTSDIYTFTTAGVSPSNITSSGSLDAFATRPSFSPDGARVAFQIKEPDTPDENIWTVGRTGATPDQVTSAAADEVEPAWSPDGTQIAYRNGATGDIYVVAAAGGTGTALTTAGTPGSPLEAPNWQPALTGLDDTESVDENGTVDVDVLANDLALGSAFGSLDTSATLVSLPTRGTATRDTDGSFIYEHDGSEIGTFVVYDTFEYTVTQGSFTSTAEVTITINPVDDDPTADPDEYSVIHAGTLSVAANEGVLVGDVDPEGLGLSAVPVDGPDYASAFTLDADGSFTYVHDGVSSAAIVDSFTYQAVDPGGNKSPVTTVTINVGPEDPDPPSIAIEGPAFGGPGIEATFSATVVDGSGPRVYDWSITQGGLEVASGSSITIDFTPTMTGLHTVELILSDSAGTDTDSFDFTVMTDIEGTFINDIVWLANEGITKGCNPPVNDQYCPDSFVTRGQMAAFLVRFLGLTDDGGGDLFEDDDNSIFESNIDKLATAEITKGCNPTQGNTNFCPDDFVTRGQMAAFLVRALGLTDDGGGDLFEDDDNSIFESNIDKLATAGITKGCNPAQGNTKFCPDDFVTRGQMAAFLNRADALKP